MIENEGRAGNPSGPEPEESPEQPRAPKESFPLGRWIILLLVPLIFMLMVMPTGFVVESPGPAFDLQDDFTVRMAQTYSSMGQFMLTAVSIQESNIVYHLLAVFDHDYRNIKETDYLGKNLDSTGQTLVDDVITVLSQNTATVEGLRGTGKQVSIQGLGVMVVSVLEGLPAFGVMNLADVIVAANGKPVGNAQDLRDIIATASGDDIIKLQVKTISQDMLRQQEDSSPENIDLSAILDKESKEYELRVATDAETGRSLIGVALRDYFTYSSEIQVDWNIENVKGPSAGLMMTLSLINALTPEDLTSGKNIAGTGEIFLSGLVGPIGGLPMKIKAAESRGAEIFIYPAGNESDLAGVTTKMKLYPVATLQEALDILNPH
ncbi:MAG: hypothetical protein A2W01_07275 [Candidatus Solincola sediminis]|uniref:endopeptidase La n=1 Tax=Candidatus Solincola sediminis TaxID=1797199 RepID=A0A1F2WRP9_9ACTN|nr:MAG: hypothetical protein A2Y75_11535 [Candidatus Solincola sediminis]OFW59927.1 MAG: hypothetical protein A2W01_07275 [Candidatus Solincola sediminis]